MRVTYSSNSYATAVVSRYWSDVTDTPAMVWRGVWLSDLQTRIIRMCNLCMPILMARHASQEKCARVRVCFGRLFAWIRNLSFVTHVPISAESETRCTCQSSGSASVFCNLYLSLSIHMHLVVTLSQFRPVSSLDIHVATVTIVSLHDCRVVRHLVYRLNFTTWQWNDLFFLLSVRTAACALSGA